MSMNTGDNMMGFLEDVYAARVTYCLEEYEDDRLERLVLGGELIEFDSGARVIVGENAKYNIVGFSAENLDDRVSFNEMISGLKDGFSLGYGTALQVHPTTLVAWQEMYSELFATINEKHYQQAADTGTSKPWLFIGYGAGGAVAQVAAASFGPARLITFGSPDAGNATLSDALFDSTVWTRWEFAGDWNAKLPMRLAKTIEGNTRFITEDGTLELRPKMQFKVFSDWYSRKPMSAYYDWLEDVQ